MPDTDTILAVDTIDDYPWPKLAEDARQRIALGDYEVHPGRDPEKPVLRWAAGNSAGRRAGSLAKGGGVSPNHIDAENARKGRIKMTSEYLALAQRIIDANDGGGFEEVLEATRETAIGTTKVTRVQCPECNHRFDAELVAPGDVRAQKLILETFLGPGVRRSEVDINMKTIQMDLSQLVDMDPKDVVNTIFREGLTPEEIERRKEYVRANTKET